MDSLKEAPAAVDWFPGTATMPFMAHTWVVGWDTGAVEALVEATRAAGWQCIVIERSTQRLAASARAAIHAAGATVVRSEPASVTEVIAAVSQRCRRDPIRGQHPVLLIVGDGDHIANEDLDLLAYLGGAADIHLAIDEQAWARTSDRLRDNVCCVYRGPREAGSDTGCESVAANRCDGAAPMVRNSRRPAKATAVESVQSR